MSELNLVLLGPPGAGKGTQAERLIEDFGLPYYSTGIILREAVEEESELGKEAKEYMDAGELVPDDLICRVVAERFDTGEADDGFLLDGFPRTVGQAEVLDDTLEGRGRELTAVLLIEAPDDEVVRRLLGPAYLREGRARLPHGVRPAEERQRLRPGRLAPDPARRRQAGDRSQAPFRLPRADLAADRVVRGQGPAASASTARARPTRCTIGYVPHWLRSVSKRSSSQ